VHGSDRRLRPAAIEIAQFFSGNEIDRLIDGRGGKQ
jgi:hypothetical protein